MPRKTNNNNQDAIPEVSKGRKIIIPLLEGLIGEPIDIITKPFKDTKKRIQGEKVGKKGYETDFFWGKYD